MTLIFWPRHTLGKTRPKAMNSLAQLKPRKLHRAPSFWTSLPSASLSTPSSQSLQPTILCFLMIQQPHFHRQSTWTAWPASSSWWGWPCLEPLPPSPLKAAHLPCPGTGNLNDTSISMFGTYISISPLAPNNPEKMIIWHLCIHVDDNHHLQHQAAVLQLPINLLCWHPRRLSSPAAWYWTVQFEQS